ncbi:MAG: FG-GAP-like repeat-containing protein [Ancrocorticia sp.]
MTIGLNSVNSNDMAASWQRYRHDAQFSVEYSRPPAIPTNLHSDPISQCSTTTTNYIRSTTPRLNWALTDPDGGNVKGLVDIIKVNGGTTVWSSSATTQASGNYFSQQVPSGVLSQGTTYEWRAKGQDVQTGKFGPAAKCRFEIDSTRPANPPTIRPADEHSPRYVANETAGGVGLAGAFTLGNAGVQDVTTYKYSFNSDALDTSVAIGANGEATISYTPTSPGQHTLYVQSVDKAGNTSNRVEYTFGVATSKPDAVWKLNEGSGGVATDSAGTNSLTVTAPWTNGPGADPALVNPPMLTDKALEFTAPAHTATSTRPAVKTTGSYTVMARVTASQLANAATVISQDGNNNAAFRLGLLPASECGSTGPCWAFQTSNSDSATSPLTTVTSQANVEKNRWYHLTGVRDTGENKIRLYVCPLSNTDPAISEKSTTSQGWNSTGNTQIGRSRTGTGYGQPWQGRIDQVRIDNVALTKDQIRQACNSGNDVFPPMNILPIASAAPPARQWGPTETTSSDLLGARSDLMYYFEGGYDPTGAKPTFGPAKQVLSTGWAAMTSITQVKGFTTTGQADIIALENTGKIWLNTSHNNGITWKEIATNWGWADHIVGVNNWGGSGTAGLIARQASDGTLWYCSYTPERGFGDFKQIGTSWNGMKNLAFAGNWDHDIYPDLLAIDTNGRLRLYRGNSNGGLHTGFTILDEAGGWQNATSLTSGADYNHDGTPDILATWNTGGLWFYSNIGGSLQTYKLVSNNWSNYKIID